MRSDQLEEVATILARGFLRHYKRDKLQVPKTILADDSLASAAEQSVHDNAVG